jgi:hypothetical protein
MGWLGGGSEAPDPLATAQAQQGVNQEALRYAALMNQINQTGPFGSVSYSGEIGSPNRTQTTTLSPEIQAILNGQLQGSQSLTNLANQRLAGAPGGNFELGNNPVGYIGQGGTPTLASEFNQGPAVTSSLGAQPGLQSNFNTGPGAQSTLDANAYGMQTGFNWGGIPIQNEFGEVGDVTRNVANAGQIQRGLGDAGQIQRGVSLAGQPNLSTDFGQLVKQSQDAAYGVQTNYLDPRFDRERGSLESRLAAQGITQDSDAYRNQIADFEANKNLAYQQATNEAVRQGADIQNTLFGQNLAARQQGVGEQFDMAGFSNDAQRQAFEQMLASGQFTNSAQAQQYGQNLSDAQFQNQAQQQAYGQSRDRVEFSNQAQQQSYDQNMGAAAFKNDATAQAFQQALAAQTANNAGAGQNFDQSRQAADFYNNAMGQSFDRDLAAAQFSNQAAGQIFGQNYDAAGFGNQALAQQFGMGLQQRNFDQNLYQQGLNNQILGRNQNINEAMAYFNGTPISGQTMPNYQGIPQSTAAQGSPDLMSLAGMNYQTQQQARSAILGSIFGAVGRVGGAAAGACWVARACYGEENPDWLAFREWLFSTAPKLIRKLYLKYGERLAEWLKNKPRTKQIIRSWMNARLNACP